MQARIQTQGSNVSEGAGRVTLPPIYVVEGGDKGAALELAQYYGLSVCATLPQQGYVLMHDGTAWQLCAQGRGAPGPVAVDFASAALHWRRKTGGRGQLVARAVGLKSNACPRVLDVTAGLGQDGFVLASLGCRVEWVERSPVAALLLADGLARARQQSDLAEIVTRLSLRWAPAQHVLREYAAAAVELRPDVVYLDPMYPDHGKSAASGKAMQAFQSCVGNDADADLLLDDALLAARKRVVVKRPRKGVFLAGRQPSHQVLGESTRFDVYLLPGATSV